MTLRPTSEAEVCEAIREAAAAGTRLAIRAGGSHDGFGHPVDTTVLDLSALAGVVDYDPAELVLTVRPGTPLAEVRALVADAGQMLAFDPADAGPVYGKAAGAATIGGTIAAGASGSQRLSCGAARDHLLGFRAVSGRGEAFVAGAKVVKNVTGYDLPKLAAGSWGRLFALTELTLKVLPAPREAVTLALSGLADAEAIAAMARALGSSAEVAAAAHVPGGPTLLRLQGFGPSVEARATALAALLASHGAPVRLPTAEADTAWEAFRTLAPLGTERPLWRIAVPARAGAQVAAALPAGGQCLFDWAGGLIWAANAGEPEAIRAVAAQADGHATLVRADDAQRARVPAFHPPAPGIAALEGRVRRAFDPAGVFETGRF